MWARFDDKGFAAAFRAEGIHIKTDEDRQKHIEEGWLEISDEDYDYYLGNFGGSYVRDPETGKPVLAPPEEVLPEEKIEALKEDYQAQFAEIQNAWNLAELANDSDLKRELRDEYQTLSEEYKNALEELKNDEG